MQLLRRERDPKNPGAAEGKEQLRQSGRDCQSCRFPWRQRCGQCLGNAEHVKHIIDLDPLVAPTDVLEMPQWDRT
jgi:hypothetical protein